MYNLEGFNPRIKTVFSTELSRCPETVTDFELDLPLSDCVYTFAGCYANFMLTSDCFGFWPDLRSCKALSFRIENLTDAPMFAAFCLHITTDGGIVSVMTRPRGMYFVSDSETLHPYCIQNQNSCFERFCFIRLPAYFSGRAVIPCSFNGFSNAPSLPDGALELASDSAKAWEHSVMPESSIFPHFMEIFMPEAICGNQTIAISEIKLDENQTASPVASQYLPQLFCTQLSTCSISCENNRAVFTAVGNRVAVKPDTAVLKSSHTPYAGTGRVLRVCFEDYDVEFARFALTSGFVLSCRNTDYLSILASDLLRAWNAKETLRLKGILCIIMSCLEAPGTRIEGYNYAFDPIIQADSIISEEYMLPLTISDIARRCGVSEGHLSRLHKKVTGVTVGKQITIVRLAAAKKLLLFSDSGLVEIAEKCGFSGAPYFSSVFKSVLGMTPGEFRAKNANKRIIGS